MGPFGRKREDDKDMRIVTLLVEDVSNDAWARPVPQNGRIAFTKWLLTGLAKRKEISEVAVLGGAKPMLQGLVNRAIGDARQVAVGPAVWLEPTRHYWFRPYLLRQALNIDIPIVSLLSGLGPGDQLGRLIASLALGHHPHDVVVAPSGFSANVLLRQSEQLAAELYKPWKPPNITTIPYGCPVPVTTPREHARRLLGLDRGELVILYLGRLTSSDKSDFSALFNALGRLQRDYPNTRLICAGGADSRTTVTDLHDQLAEYGLATSVLFRANVSNTEKHLLYSAADIFVSPSNTISESFGLSIVEAMFHKLPIVCSAWSGYREIVRDGIDGLLVPVDWNGHVVDQLELSYIAGDVRGFENLASVDPAGLAERLRRLAASADLRRSLGERAYSRATAEYSMDTVLDRFCALFQELQPIRSGRSRETTSEWSIVESFSAYAG